MKFKCLMVVLMFVVVGVGVVFVVVVIDLVLLEYQKVSGVLGNLLSVGFDILVNLMIMWVEEYKCFYLNVNIQIQVVGFFIVLLVLIEGIVNLGLMSCKMKDVELQVFEQKYGYKLIVVLVVVDVLVIFVYKDNLIKGLIMQQVDVIFFVICLCGSKQDVKIWGDLGLIGDWVKKLV